MSIRVPAATNKFATGQRCSTCSASWRMSSYEQPGACTTAVPDTCCTREGCCGVQVMGISRAPRSSLHAVRSKSIRSSFRCRGQSLRATKCDVACLHPTRAAKRCSTGCAPAFVPPAVFGVSVITTFFVAGKDERARQLQPLERSAYSLTFAPAALATAAVVACRRRR